MRAVFVLMMTAAMAGAQQVGTLHTTPESRQAALQNLRQLKQQLTSLKADETRSEAQLQELLKTYRESHPNVLALRKKLDRLRAQNEALSQALPHLDALQSLTNLRLQPGFSERWWRNPSTAREVGLTADQVKRMDGVFQEFRLKLVDLTAALEREEVTLEPLVAAESLQEARITTQIDRIAQARAELEKANGRMLLGIRKLLTPEQWSKLNR